MFCIFFTLIEKEVGEHLHSRTLTEEEQAFILTLNPAYLDMHRHNKASKPMGGFADLFFSVYISGLLIVG